MNPGRIIKVVMVSILLFCMVFTTAIAGTYTETESIRGGFSDQTVAIKNTLGATFQVHPYEFSPSVNGVKSFSAYYKVNSIALNIYIIDVDVYYSTDGINFIRGDRIENIQAGRQYTYSISFGSTTKTVAAIAFVPNVVYNPGISYTVQSPRFTLVKEDNISPTISLLEQSNYSKDSVTITASITDSQSGVSVCKWTQGIQSLSYFSVSGSAFTDTFAVAENGYYTVYAKDIAGNEVVNYIYVTKIDRTPPIITASASTVWDITNTITAAFTDSQSGVSIQKWVLGSQTASYFQSGGNLLSGSTITVTANGIYTIYAKDSAGNESVAYVTVSCVDNMISITHPLTVNYTIDPNLPTPFAADDICLINNSRIKVNVSIEEFASIPRGNITLTDVMPSYFSDWNALTTSQTKQYIALGVKVKETISFGGWNYINTSSTIYAAEIDDPIWLGTLNSNGAQGKIQLSANHGLAWDGNYTVKHRLTLLFIV